MTKVSHPSFQAHPFWNLCCKGGAHLGPKEAEANLKLLEIEFEHLGFKCVGAFSCPGNLRGAFNEDWYWGDISDRTNAKDLADATAFVDKFLQLDEVKTL